VITSSEDEKGDRLRPENNQPDRHAGMTMWDAQPTGSSDSGT
jgi:hypothetical protein